ncbi:MAG: excinuclease ABC subunit UvrA [Chlamydiota bacterium]|nr:excinuclease ABC subunit UvrA [Chlamydiota bacterium]
MTANHKSIENSSYIHIYGVREHNLKNIDVHIPIGKVTVLTGVSGSGKSSLAFNTLYAEGQRRYIESFSAYARQFMDRMNKPDVDKVEGILPAIAISQTDRVRSSRSTVGTLSGISDYIKLLFAKKGQLYCTGCERPVQIESPQHIYAQLMMHFQDQHAVIAFPVKIPQHVNTKEILESFGRQAFLKGVTQDGLVALNEKILSDHCSKDLSVYMDQGPVNASNQSRLIESLELAYRFGKGKLLIYIPSQDVLRFSEYYHCADCDLFFSEPNPNVFSFNSPIGACSKCNGFGRILDIDLGRVIPDISKSIEQGCVRPWQTQGYNEAQKDLLRYAGLRGIPVDVSYKDLPEESKKWLIEGEGEWYGILGFFDWLKTKSYKMHIRVLLSKYRNTVLCPDCHGARLKPEALHVKLSQKHIAQVYAMYIDDAYTFFSSLFVDDDWDKVSQLLLREIISRLVYLRDVGLGYLNLERQSRTLSGGELERVNLTTAIGTNLVNTLFILDEPSIGLHPRDNARLIGLVHRLKENHNTVVLVEHDPEIIQSADHCIDLGPGSGEDGGRIVFQGSIHDLMQDSKSLTGRYLSAKLAIHVPTSRRNIDPDYAIEILKASEHNLKNIDVHFPLGVLVCVTGVSGSGKSTLVEEILYRAILREKGVFKETPGSFQEIKGGGKINECILVDQSPIGRSPRANPATYMKIFGPIRQLFSEVPLARIRGFSPQTFSFNMPGGRCERCQGEGYEKIEMQFLSDVFVECADCLGKRFRPEVMEIEFQDKNIGAVLDLTVQEAMEFFHDYSAITRPLKVLETIGLDYLKLGQPINTLSGGESQRLKLAYFMGVIKRKSSLFIFDEPTTGLHFSDIRRLLYAFDELIENGNTCIIVEHNLEVIKCADYVIDLGPEGGEAGGYIVAQGSPEAIASNANSITGRYLREVLEKTPRLATQNLTTTTLKEKTKAIILMGAKEHNLKNISLSIPRNQFVVITGLSGSGKSTLAFDIIFAEGRRRYIESLSAYARQFMGQLSRPDVDWVDGIPPTIAIEQRMSCGGWRSTVATETEIYHYMRLLYAKLGEQHCHQCHERIQSQSLDQIYDYLLKKHQGQTVRFLAPVIRARKGIYKEVFKQLKQKGIREARIDGRYRKIDPLPQLKRFKEHNIDAVVASMMINNNKRTLLKETIQESLLLGKGCFYVSTRNSDDVLFSLKLYCPNCDISFEELDPRMFSYNSKMGCCPKCNGYGFTDLNEEQSGEGGFTLCPVCQGKRLKESVLGVRVRGLSIGEVSALSVRKGFGYFKKIKLNTREEIIVGSLIKEICTRLEFLIEVGLPYLSLDRSVRSLSGGELQRIRLASQLGSQLQGACYILDEPTIGLHPRDNQRLIRTLKALQERGNSIIVVEHDEETMRSADQIIDLGPGAGRFGGEIVAQGTVEEIVCVEASTTGHYLSGLMEPIQSYGRSLKNVPCIKVYGAQEHNLKNINVEIPLGRLVCVTGVSGSGKSTLIRDVLFHALRRDKYQDELPVGKHKKITGQENIERVVEVDQSPIGKTPRSVPASYVGFWNDIRALYAMMPEAKLRGYAPGRFSFNVKSGRCEKCAGQGRIAVEMNFLPEVYIVCDNCKGRRFNDETLQVLFKNYDIAQILNMTIEEAEHVFINFPKIYKPLQLLREIGLGYVTLGQASNTLSGGEAQRIKLAYELTKESRGKTIYFLDEPTTGLHYADIRLLMNIIHKLINRGNTVVIIEHNLEVIWASDYVIDLGPEGGDNGGYVVAAGSPEEIVRCAQKSYTGRFLKKHKVNSSARISLEKVD